MIKFKYVINRRYDFVSRYNINFIKKFLSAKLLFTNYSPKDYLYNLNNYFSKKKIKKSIIKKFYIRKEKAPIRVLRYFLYFDDKFVKLWNFTWLAKNSWFIMEKDLN